MAEITLPEVELNIYSPKDPTEITVVENYVCTKESSPNFVRHMTFDVSGTELEGRVRIGQSIGILPPGEDERGKPHKLRLYSVSSPTEGEEGINEHHPQTQQLDLGQPAAGSLDKRQISQQRHSTIRRTEHRKNTGENNQRAGSKK